MIGSGDQLTVLPTTPGSASRAPGAAAQGCTARALVLRPSDAQLGRDVDREAPLGSGWYHANMKVAVEVRAQGGARPPAGAPVIVQVRDTSLADAPAVVLGTSVAAIAGGSDPCLARLVVDVDRLGPSLTVWAHVDVDRDGRVSRGDYVSVQSFPVPAGPQPRAEILVKPV
jgi:uncharacterized lipoprotein YbaY